MTLRLDKIGKSINRNWIVRDLEFQVNQGECLALLGPSGCGKSTTLRLIAGLDRANEGKIFINNKDVTTSTSLERKVGMVFQSYALFPHLTVANNLLLGLKVRGIPIDKSKKKVSNIISLMQLEPFANRFPSELSGGQRQRVALARALLREANVYLLDEPMSNLDAQLREELRPELRKIITSDGKPIVYVTHDQQEAMSIANNIAVLNNGKLEQIGSPRDLYERPSSLFVAKFIGRPQINLIMAEKNISIGIRPEDIYFDEEGIPAKILYKEWHGNTQLISLNTSRGELRMTCEGSFEVPNTIKVSWNKKKELKFNAITGNRI